MKILKKLGDDIVPLSRKQNVVLMVIIACVFQFILLYAPALADETVSRQKAQTAEQEMLAAERKQQVAAQEKLMAEAADLIVANDSVIKSAIMDAEAGKIMTTTAQTLLEPEDKAAAIAPEIKILRTGTHVISAYNSEAAQTDASPCITANGFNVCEHGVEDTIAANFLKFGTKVQIPALFGDRVFVVRDRMNKRYPDRVDVWMLDKHDALQFGVRTAKINIVVIEEPIPDNPAITENTGNAKEITKEITKEIAKK